jgi:DNA-directed RNA polymerase specialized sigma24 family protein
LSESKNGTESLGDPTVEGSLFGAGPGSRDAVAVYLLKNRAVLKHRILRKLRHAGFAGVDPDDVQSSVLRRVDAAMLRGVLRTSNEREFWGFVTAVTDNAVLTRLRAGHRGHRGQLSLSNQKGENRLDRCFGSCRDNDEAAALLYEMMVSMRSEDDRELVMWKLGGSSYGAISATTGRSEAALRTQWARVCRDLRERFSQHGRSS